MTTRPRTPAPNTPAPGKLALPELAELKRRGQKIAMVTAYDAPSGRLADAAGVDVVLVGDSAAMTVLGHDSTVPATMEEMLVLTRAVTRGATRPLVVADMPFGSFQVSDEHALEHAIRFVKEAGADAVKLEGAGPTLARVRTIVGAGIPVMGHIGLTPQSATMLGGFKAQGRTADKARRLLDDALALEAAGCFAVVLEAVPAPVAERITAALAIPTIGIGAGLGCDGQVLVYHGLLGLYEGHAPRFVKQYADLAGEIRRALEAYVADVRAGAFPEERHTYAMPEEELEEFLGAWVAGGRRVDRSVQTDAGAKPVPPEAGIASDALATEYAHAEED
jgi:3-methyl-2-oxobutanoate hydroxymethyltransferase